MGNWSFSEADRLQAQTLGISEPQIHSQIQIFERASYFVKLVRPCTVGDGIRRIPVDAMEEYRRIQAEAASQGRFIKFVPASGAASRMFQVLSHYCRQPNPNDLSEIRQRASEGDAGAAGFLQFMDGCRRFAFWEDLETALAAADPSAGPSADGMRWRLLLECLLTERGLNYEGLPKGLLKFHRYPEGGRTAFEEHLVEAVHYVRDAQGVCRLHLTVSPEHRAGFAALLDAVRGLYEAKYGVRLEVTFSEQHRSTDTIAVDLHNRPFRGTDGSLVFRPGGHGALLTNLNDLAGDLIYIKNIDNVVPDRLKEDTIIWKQALGGYLVAIQRKVHGFVERFASRKATDRVVEEASRFVADELAIQLPFGIADGSVQQRGEQLLHLLNRPLRVCGMVQNVGDPGGGPFWVSSRDGAVSRQIVESAQVNLQSENQQAVWMAATHFNPVDLVCGVRDYRGQPFDLHQFVDPDAVFVATKSKDGRQLKAMELPGLWNGAMAHWITLFVEVPRITFNPVKTVNALLSAEHQ
ncbi:MAG TPA: DUF4301 domain-containing protein [Syntrophobacteraceae bacterium]|nr:DUF4301 domain-containing protein [Syntrophobacteraceae bacterium]